MIDVNNYLILNPYIEAFREFTSIDKALLLPPDKVDKRLEGRTIIPMDKVLRTPKRNELCPCGSGKKFKKCCGL